MPFEGGLLALLGRRDEGSGLLGAGNATLHVGELGYMLGRVRVPPRHEHAHPSLPLLGVLRVRFTEVTETNLRSLLGRRNIASSTSPTIGEVHQAHPIGPRFGDVLDLQAV